MVGREARNRRWSASATGLHSFFFFFGARTSTFVPAVMRCRPPTTMRSLAVMLSCALFACFGGMVAAVFLHDDFHGEDFLHAAGLFLADGHGAILDDILIVDDPNVAVALIGADGHLRHDERRVRIADRHSHSHKHAGGEDARADFGLLGWQARRGFAGCRWRDRFGCSRNPFRRCRDSRSRRFAAPTPMFRWSPLPTVFSLPSRMAVMHAQQGEFIDVEVDVHRVLRDDRGEHGFVGVNQIADRDQVAADDAADQRGDVGEFEIYFARLRRWLPGRRLRRRLFPGRPDIYRRLAG